MKPEEKEAALYLLAAETISRMEDERYLVYHAKSIDLIRFNAARGMSRSAMKKIWSEKLLNLVLWHEQNFIKNSGFGDE